MNAASPTPYTLNSSETVAQLMKLVARTQKLVPFYQKHFGHLDLASFSLQLTDLPLLDKATVRAAGETMIQEGYYHDQPGCISSHTSGSTGTPLRLLRTRSEEVLGARAFWRARAAIFPDVMNTRGLEIYSFGSNSNKPFQKNKKFILPTVLLHFHEIDEYLDQMDMLQPVWLSGAPALLTIVAEGLRRKNRRLKTQLAFVESTGDWLSLDVRNLLAEVFNCPIVNHYGTIELRTMAYECRKGALHIIDDCVVIELLPLEGTNEKEIVASSLILETMPFIRYRVGDRVQSANSDCTCGNTAPVLGELQGRIGDVIAGTALLGHPVFAMLMKNVLASSGLQSLLQYQIHQTNTHHFVVQLKLRPFDHEVDTKQFAIFKQAFQEMGANILPNAQFEFEQVDFFELTPHGKMQYFIRHV